MIRIIYQKSLSTIVRAGMLLALVFWVAAFSQAPDNPPSPVNFTVTVPSDTFTIGDEVPVKIEVVYPADIKITPPAGQLEDTAFVLKKGPQIESKSEGANNKNTYTFVILPISIGDIPTPAFEFYWSDVSGKAYRSTAPQRTIHVRSLLPTDTTGIDIKDIIGPKSLPVRWWPYVLSAAIVLALIAAWYFHYRRKLSKMEIPVVPPEPPFDKAIRELAILKENDLLGKGKIKQFYIELSDILRRYIEGRFDIKAVEATTYELKRMLKHPELSKEQTYTILEFLGRSDLVKFAKFKPAAEYPADDYALVRNLIIATKPIETAARITQEAAK
jgi:hypothetical protein